MPYDDTDHSRHGHLDGGACLDGTGRRWEPVPHVESRPHLDGICGCPLSRVERVGYLDAPVEARLHTLIWWLLLLNVAVVLIGVAVVLLAIAAL